VADSETVCVWGVAYAAFSQVAKALPASVVLMGAAAPYRNDFLPSFHRSRLFRAAALPSRHFQVPVNERLYARMALRPRGGVPSSQVNIPLTEHPLRTCASLSVSSDHIANAERGCVPNQERWLRQCFGSHR
jgi:hypothetical protein